MDNIDLNNIKKIFALQDVMLYPNRYSIYHNKKCRIYNHKDFDFTIVVFDKTDEVYQLNERMVIYGVELKTWDELCIRFKSITGENIDNKV